MFTVRVAILSKKKATDFGLAQVLQNDTWSGSVSFCPIQPSGREPRAPSHPMIMSPQSIAPYSRGLPVRRCSRGETSFKRTTRAVETSPLRFLLGIAMMVAGAIGTRVEGRAATIFDVPTNELPDPAIIASATPFSSTYTAANVFDGIFRTGSGEYATTNAVSGDAFIDFDFGSPTTVGGFVFYQRLGGADGVTSFQLLFANAPDFLSPISTLTFATSGTRDFDLLNDSAGIRQEFAFASGIEARYVKWDVVSAVGNGYDGAAEMEFWGGAAVVPEPSACLLVSCGLFGLAGRRIRRQVGRRMNGS